MPLRKSATKFPLTAPTTTTTAVTVSALQAANSARPLRHAMSFWSAVLNQTTVATVSQSTPRSAFAMLSTLAFKFQLLAQTLPIDAENASVPTPMKLGALTLDFALRYPLAARPTTSAVAAYPSKPAIPGALKPTLVLSLTQTVRTITTTAAVVNARPLVLPGAHLPRSVLPFPFAAPPTTNAEIALL